MSVDPTRSRRFGSLGAVLAVALLAAACSPAGASPSPASGNLSATLSEWKIDVSAASAPAGSLAFAITNQGAVPHEFLMIRTDMMANALPVKDNMIDVMAMGGPMGSGMNMPGMSPAPEMAHPVGTVGVIGEIAAGASDQLVMDNLAPGHYAIICDLPTHYELGMRVDFTVGP